MQSCARFPCFRPSLRFPDADTLSVFHSIRTKELHQRLSMDSSVQVVGVVVCVSSRFTTFFGYGEFLVFIGLGRQHWWQGRKLSWHVGKISLSSVSGFSFLQWETSGVRTLDIQTCKSKLTMTIDRARHEDIGFRWQYSTCTIHHFTLFTFWDIEDIHHISSTYASSQVTTITTSSGCYFHLPRISATLQELTTPTHSMSQRGSLRLRLCLL